MKHEKDQTDQAREAYSQSHATDSPTAPVNEPTAASVSLMRLHLAYLREALAELVEYTLTGDADEDDAQLLDRVDALRAKAPCVKCGTTEASDGDWYRLCGTCRWGGHSLGEKLSTTNGWEAGLKQAREVLSRHEWQGQRDEILAIIDAVHEREP